MEARHLEYLVKLLHFLKDMRAVPAILWAWFGYTEFAFRHDKLVFTTVPTGGDDGMHMAATAIDALDTLILANVDYSPSIECVKAANITTSKPTNFFEATIRVLGGLVSAYSLTNDPIIKDAAVRIGDSLLKAFHGLPCATLVNEACVPKRTVSIAVAGSNVLEFSQLTKITGDRRYKFAALSAFDILVRSALANDFVLPSHVDQRGTPSHGAFSYSGESDSFWEYVLKDWIYEGCKNQELRDLFDGVVERFRYHKIVPTGHLDCFFPGLLTLSYLYNGPVEHFLLAEELMDNCLAFYNTPTGLGVDAKTDVYTKLRPEVMESLYYFYFVTREEKYAAEAQKIMMAIETYAKQTEGGYCGVNVNTGKCPRWPGGEYHDEGSMPSFFLAETLKYYLLLNNTIVTPLTHVFTTEAHLMPITNQASLCRPRNVPIEF